MSRESKIFTTSKLKISEKVKDYESFGWELLSINGTDVSMSRETQNKVYVELVKYEHQYEELALRRNGIEYPKKPTNMDAGIVILLLMLFIIPGIIYIYVKVQQDKKYNELYSIAESERMRLEDAMKDVCNVSRATFYSKQ